jgi:site-specific DNA recombinase
MDTFTYQRLSQDRYGTSPNCAIQERENRNYAQVNSDTVVGSYSDNDISISKEGRKRTKPRIGYPQMLAAIQAHPRACRILVTEMPRLYRELDELLQLFELAGNTQLQRIETTDGQYYDLSTGAGIHAAIIAVSNAALESRRISDRVKRNRRDMAEQGRPHTGSRAYGYDPTGMVVVDNEAAVIRECVERLLDGAWPLSSIVRDLNEREVLTAAGGKWTAHKLRAVLLSPRITGIRTHLGVEYPGQWPAIIEPATQKKVVARLQAAERFKGVNKKGVRTYLLTGLVYCGVCGKPLLASGGAYGNRGHTGRRYRCKKANVYGLKHGCGKISRLAEPVELVVTDAVLKRYSSEAFVAALTETPDPTENADFTQLVNDEALFKENIFKVEKLFTSGKIDDETMLRLKGDIERELEAVRAKMAKHETGRLLLTMPTDSSLLEAWDLADLDQRRQLVSLLVERVTLLPSRPGGHYWTHERSEQRYVFDPSAVQIAWRV